MIMITTPIPAYNRVGEEDEVVVVAAVETMVVGTALVTVDTTVEPPEVTVESTVEESVETVLTVAVTVETATELEEELTGAASNNVSSQNTGLVSACVL